MIRSLTNLLTCAIVAALLVPGLWAQNGLMAGGHRDISENMSAVPGGANPGDAAAKVKLVRLFNTPMGSHDGRLVSVYGDANHTGMVWHPKSGVHQPQDIFARYSDDNGATWSAPVNLSQTAGLYSAMSDWDGDGVDEFYYGDSAKPNIFNNGNTIVVSWVDKYCPEESWTWGQTGNSTVQGRAQYPDINVFPNQREVPYSGTYLAISYDGGTTWAFGDSNPPLQLTYGRRDAIQDVNRGAGKKWIVTWQEDPEGLQPGEGEGPGTGASGAKVTKGTDIWYTYTADITVDPMALRTNRTPLTNHSSYDLTATNGFPIDGNPGGIENHGASRANTHIVNDAGVFKAIVAYEETKGTPDIVEGKTIQYHAFPYNMPVQNGLATSVTGVAGATLTPFIENARRVRFVRQTPNGTNTALTIFWKQGTGTQGAPSDIMLKTSTSLDEAAVAAAPTLNMSTGGLSATPANYSDATGLDPLEDARAHRAFMRGNTILLGYSYSPNGLLARYTDQANYNFYIRRSVDGGQTWEAPQNVSNISDTTINVKEPRIVGTPSTGTQDNDALVIAWGTETNGYEGIDTPEDLDIVLTRTLDAGATYEPVITVAGTAGAEFESQLRPNEDVSEIYVTWMQNDGLAQKARFAVVTGARNPLQVNAFNDSTVPGGVFPMYFEMPGFALSQYLALASLGTSPGIVTSFGTIPLVDDALLSFSLMSPNVFVGFSGISTAIEQGFGTIFVPSFSWLSGTQFYVAFVALTPGGTYGISDAKMFTIL